MTAAEAPARDEQRPDHASWVLVGLIAVASVANLNLAVANVALPDIGLALHADQTGLNLVSVGFSLGLAGTVLYLGALGDRYGRKGMLMLGMALTVPTSLLAAWATSIPMLFFARLLGGVAAGMAYPTTLALITALWSGKARTKSIALWSAIGGSMVPLASLLAGWLLTRYWWGSVFLLTAPLAIGALALAARYVPAHVNETSDGVDNLGGVLSVIGIIALVLAINFAPSKGEQEIALVAGALAVVALGAFFAVQRRSVNPLFDLKIASRRIFWVAAVAGLIVFGTLMGSMYVGEQFLQNVLGYSTLRPARRCCPPPWPWSSSPRSRPDDRPLRLSSPCWPATPAASPRSSSCSPSGRASSNERRSAWPSCCWEPASGSPARRRRTR